MIISNCLFIRGCTLLGHLKRCDFKYFYFPLEFKFSRISRWSEANFFQSNGKLTLDVLVLTLNLLRKGFLSQTAMETSETCILGAFSKFRGRILDKKSNILFDYGIQFNSWHYLGIQFVVLTRLQANVDRRDPIGKLTGFIEYRALLLRLLFFILPIAGVS